MKKEDLSIKEEWKDIKNYEGLYQISSCCRNKQKSAGGYIWKYC